MVVTTTTTMSKSTLTSQPTRILYKKERKESKRKHVSIQIGPKKAANDENNGCKVCDIIGDE